MEDQGLASHLLNAVNVQTSPLHDLTRGLFTNSLPQFHYRPELNSQCFQYRTRGGAWVPLAFKTVYGHLGIIPCVADEPTPTAIGSARSFLKNFSDGKVLIACKGRTTRVFDDSLLAVPYAAIL